MPEEKAIALINDLMDNGFSVEISVVYTVLLGAESVRYNNLTLYVTEASK